MTHSKQNTAMNILTDKVLEVSIPELHSSTRVGIDGLYPTIVPEGRTAEHMIAKIARCSYGAQPKTPMEDERLIRYLQRHRHTSPFEFANITFFLENIPLFCAVQILRHRTGKFNMKSHRYTESDKLDDGAFLDIRDRLRVPHQFNKQSSVERDTEEHEKSVLDIAQEAHESVEHTRQVYHELIKQGIAKEVARCVLPEGELTSLYVQFDLSNLCKFLSLRLHSTAQLETTLIAKAMCDLAIQFFPIVIGGMLDDMKGVFLSGRELEVLRGLPLAPVLVGDEKRSYEDKIQRLGFTL